MVLKSVEYLPVFPVKSVEGVHRKRNTSGAMYDAPRVAVDIKYKPYKSFSIPIKKPLITEAYLHSLHNQCKVTPKMEYHHQNRHNLAAVEA